MSARIIPPLRFAPMVEMAGAQRAVDATATAAVGVETPAPLPSLLTCPPSAPHCLHQQVAGFHSKQTAITQQGPVILCPAGHQLVNVHHEQQQGSMWICDGCGRMPDATQDCGRFQCGLCDYDLCGTCVSKWRRPVSKDLLRCPRGHSLTVFAKGENQGPPWICDGCEYKSDSAADVGRFRCAQCDFDLCEACPSQLHNSPHVSSLKCPSGHKLIASLAASTPWACSYCCKCDGWEAGAIRYTCRQCGFDQCETCRAVAQSCHRAKSTGRPDVRCLPASLPPSAARINQARPLQTFVCA
jgi:hypothetical protein